MGKAIAELCVKNEIEVVLANTRGPESLKGLVAELGQFAKTGTVLDAVHCDYVILAVPYRVVYHDLPKFAWPMTDKIVIDTTNYFDENSDEFRSLGNGMATSTEYFAEFFPGARFVKALNTISAKHLLTQGQLQGTADRRAIPIAGDEFEAKKHVTSLIDLFGFDSLDVGELHQGGRFQPGSPSFNKRMNIRELHKAIQDSPHPCYHATATLDNRAHGQEEL
jgi:predicted dinucleotide-binding enzyme